MGSAGRWNERPQAGIGALLVVDHTFEGRQAAVASGADPDLHDHGVALAGLQHDFAPLQAHADRPAGVVGQHRRPAAEINGGVLLAPETPAHGGLPHPHPVDGHPQHGVHVAAHGERRLHGSLHPHDPAGLRHGHDYIRLQIGVVQKGDLVGSLEDHLSLAKALRDVALAEFVVGKEVALFVNPGCILPHGRANVKDSRQRFVVHLDQIQCALSHFLGVGRHQGHRVTHKSDLVSADHRLIRNHRAKAVAARHIPGGQHRRHPRQSPGFFHPDPAEDRMRVGTAQDFPVQKSRLREIRAEQQLSGDFGQGVLAGHRLPDHAGAQRGHGGRLAGIAPFPGQHRGFLRLAALLLHGSILVAQPPVPAPGERSMGFLCRSPAPSGHHRSDIPFSGYAGA